MEVVTLAHMVAKDPNEKIARQRLTDLQLAESLGSVTEAYRHGGMDWTSFYAWKKRFDESGLDGIKDLSTAHHTHPQTTSTEVEEKIVELLTHPGWGCIKLSDWLRSQNVSVSSPIVQKILIKRNMCSKFDRLMRLEERHLTEEFPLTEDQIRLIEMMNPIFVVRHVESSRPGELLCQDTKLEGTISGIGRVFRHSVVDTYSSFAFGFLHTSKQPEAAVAVLYNDVIPQYQEWNLPIENILTDNGREFCGTDAHPYELFLQLHDIGHRTTQVRHPQTNDFVERLNRTIKEEFIESAFRKKLYICIEEPQDDLDIWLKQYNFARPHRGYRILGKRHFDTIKSFIKK